MKKKAGIIIYGHAKYDGREFRVALTLANLGHYVEILAPSRHQHVKTPDFKIDNLFWELKCPTKNGKYTLQHCIQSAIKQSENIIIDLRYLPGSYRQYLSKLQVEFSASKKLKRLRIITKAQTAIDLEKKK